MNLKKKTLLLSISFLSLSIFNLALAQTTGTSSVKEIVVATVSIDNAKIISQNNRDFTLSFDLSNKTGVQPQVRYAVKLTKMATSGEVIADEKVFDEVLALNAGDIISKRLNYHIPDPLSEGLYRIFVDVSTNSGLILASGFMGDVNISGNVPNTIEIIPGSCALILNGQSLSKTENFALQAGDSPTLICQVASSFVKDLTLNPKFIIREHSIFGAILQETTDTKRNIAINQGGINGIFIDMPKVIRPQDYNVEFSLVSEDQKIISNTIHITYTLVGQRGTIQNAVFDKTSYKSGEVANLQIFSTQTSAGTLSVGIYDDSGESCSATTTKQISNFSIINLSIPVIKDCLYPKANISVSDTNKVVLDTRDFSTKSITTLPMAKIILVLTIAITVLLIGYLLKKRKYRGFALFALLILSSFFIHTENTYAWTYDCAAHYNYPPSNCSAGSQTSFHIYINKDGNYQLLFNGASERHNFTSSGQRYDFDFGKYPENNNLTIYQLDGADSYPFDNPGDCNSFYLDRPSCPPPPPPPPPGATLRTTPDPLPYNTQATLYWTSTNTSYCTLNRNGQTSSWTTNYAGDSGTITSANLTATSTFTLSCTGNGGTATAPNLVVRVWPPLSIDITADDTAVPVNSSTKVFWTANSIAFCTVTKGGANPITINSAPNLFEYSYLFNGGGGPVGVALNSGYTYVSNLAGNITKRDALGNLTTVMPKGTSLGQVNGPYEITFDSSNNLYIADAGSNRIQKRTPSAQYSSFGVLGTANGQFTQPFGLTIGPNGKIYVADSNNNRVQIFDSNFNYLSKFGSVGTSSGQFKVSRSIALDSSGNIFVVDRDNNRVQKFSPTGTYISQFGSLGSGPGQFNGPRGIAIDPFDNIYVSDMLNGRIEIFDPSGNFFAQVGSKGSLPQQLGYPLGITLDAGSNIYVADNGNQAVKKFSRINLSANADSGPITQDTLFTLSCTGLGGETLSKSVNITALQTVPPPTVNISASPSTINFDGTSTISWNATNANACSLTKNGNNLSFATSTGPWVQETAPEANTWQSVTYGNGTFVAVSSNGTKRVMTSIDGINWTGRTAVENNQWYSVAYGNGLFVAVAGGNTGNYLIMTSPDGKNWTGRTSPRGTWDKITYGNGLFVVVGYAAGGVMTSPDGINWTSRTPIPGNWISVTYGNGLFVAVSPLSTNPQQVMTSPDGITWTGRTAAEANMWMSVTYGNGLFVAVASPSAGSGPHKVMTSPDGITWTGRTASESSYWRSVTYGNGLFVAVGYNGTNNVMTSPDGINWTSQANAEANQWYGVTYGNGQFVSVANNGTNRIMKSVFNTSSIVIPTENLSTNTTYTVTCSGPSGTASDSVTVTVNAPVTVTPPSPTINITSASASVSPGATTNISWNATNVDSCSVTRNGNSWKTNKNVLEYVSQFGSQGSGNGQFNYPYGIAADASGNTYVADYVNNRVQKFNSSDAYALQFPVTAPNGIAVDAVGNVYVSDYTNNKVQKFNPSGTLLKQFGTSGTGNGQFSRPAGIAIDSNGNIYVADSANRRVQKFDYSGTYVSQFGSLGTGNGQFLQPDSVAVDGLNNVYVTDSQNNNVQKFNSSGTYISKFGSSGTGNGQFDRPFAVAIDSYGNIFVADTYNNRVQKFSSTGSYISQFGSFGTGDAQFHYPLGITTHSGNTYVDDAYNHRIQKFTQSYAISSSSDSIINTDTTFVATCTGPGGSANANVKVLITGPHATISSDQDQVSPNSTVKITWSSTDANSCTISEGTDTNWKTGLSGSADSDSLSADTIFKIKCTGVGGGTSEASTTVTILGPQATITASPMSVASNDTSTISWTSKNADSCEITQGGTPWKTDLSGSATSDPIAGDSAVTFTISCTGAAGSVTDSVTVSSGNASTNEKEYFTCQPPTGTLFINKPTTWTIPTSHTITGTDWSGTNITGQIHTTGKTFTKTYTTVGKKYIYATSTGPAGTALDPTTYTAVCSNSATLFAPSGTSTEI